MSNHEKQIESKLDILRKSIGFVPRNTTCTLLNSNAILNSKRDDSTTKLNLLKTVGVNMVIHDTAVQYERKRKVSKDLVINACKTLCNIKQNKL